MYYNVNKKIIIVEEREAKRVIIPNIKQERDQWKNLREGLRNNETMSKGWAGRNTQ